MNGFSRRQKLQTRIGFGTRDCYGNPIPVKEQGKIHRLRILQKRVNRKQKPPLISLKTLKEINRIATRKNIPSRVKEEAVIIYRRAQKNNIVKGRNVEAVAATAIYAACRKWGYPLTLDEIAETSEKDRKLIGRYYRILSQRLNLKLMPLSPQDYIPKFCGKLDLPSKIQNSAFEITEQAQKNGLTTGKNPSGIAGAAIYIAALLGEEWVTQKKISEVSGMTELSIRNRYKEMVDKLGIDKEAIREKLFLVSKGEPLLRRS